MVPSYGIHDEYFFTLIWLHMGHNYIFNQFFSRGSNKWENFHYFCLSRLLSTNLSDSNWPHCQHVGTLSRSHLPRDGQNKTTHSVKCFFLQLCKQARANGMQRKFTKWLSKNGGHLPSTHRSKGGMGLSLLQALKEHITFPCRFYMTVLGCSVYIILCHAWEIIGSGEL